MVAQFGCYLVIGRIGRMKKLMWLGIALIASGVLSAILEQVFYGGRLDENNVVQESFFLPLAFILIFLGVDCSSSS